MEEIVAPDFGESVFEASVGKWFKAEGDTVQTGEPIVELHTDKAVQEINAVRDGTVGTLLKQIDDVVRPGDALCEFQSEDAVPANATTDSDNDVTVVMSEVSSESVVADVENGEIEDVIVETSDESEDEDDGFVEINFGPFVETVTTSEPDIPSADEATNERSITPETVLGQDATAVDTLESETEVYHTVDQETQSDQATSTPRTTETQSQISELRQIVDDKPVRRERLSRRRLTAARRMAQVQAEAVMTTTYNEVDMFEVIRIRREHGESFMESHGVKLGFMSFFVKAVLNGLKAFPILNAELDGDELIYKDYYDIGIAVASDHGLVVPVVREADQKSFAEIEGEIRSFGDKARTGSFALADLVGGTFTITNGGVFGSMMSTPILNPPQVGILGMHNIVDRAVIVDGEIAVRPMMYLAVTYDHRVVEGAHAVQFLMRIKESLESAEMLMLGG